jgi:hypothetical protein
MTNHQETEIHEVGIETPEGIPVVGRITGKCITGIGRDVTAFLTKDGRVLIHDDRRSKVYDVSDDPVKAFKGWFRDADPEAYVNALEAIGEKPYRPLNVRGRDPCQGDEAATSQVPIRLLFW